MFFKKLKQFRQKLFNLRKHDVTLEEADLTKRMDRLERHYIVLLKRMLEIDGVQLRLSSFTSKILSTPNDEFNKGLNEPEPTIH